MKLLKLTGKWRRANNCIEVEIEGLGWFPAPLTMDAPESVIKAYFASA